MGVEQSIANYVKEFLDYEEKNNSGLSRSYMWVCVLIDVRQSLMRTKKIRKQGGEAKEVLFKYEKLGVFCYYSGLLGHILKTTVKGFFLQALMMALVCGEKGLGLNWETPTPAAVPGTCEVKEPINGDINGIDSGNQENQDDNVETDLIKSDKKKKGR